EVKGIPRHVLAYCTRSAHDGGVACLGRRYGGVPGGPCKQLTTAPHHRKPTKPCAAKQRPYSTQAQPILKIGTGYLFRSKGAWLNRLRNRHATRDDILLQPSLETTTPS
ncbi:unnamed protein product, partial [Ectocarpus sp. 12 AP-2014]